MNKIDTHQHLLYPSEFSYSWTKDFPDLQGDLHLEDYQAAGASCDIDYTLFMEVDVDTGQNVKEANFFHQLATEPANKMLGIIAKALPEETDFEAQLDQIANPSLKGIRRVLHTQPDTLSQSPLFRKNLKKLGQRGLSFDLCVTQKQLHIALELVRTCPEVSFILDHCGVPDIAGHTSTDCTSWQQWRSGIHALGAEPNVACKLSGLTAYAKPEQRSVEDLRPYLTEILEAFGTERIVWGGDWPVCNLGDGLQGWCQLTDSLLEELSNIEQQKILSENARRLYRL
jgi:predicted TIM-barrel fold metal-dependent hydrolase